MADQSLEELLDAARMADPIDRIEYRDPIAKHGPAAVAALRPLLADSTMRGFAVRAIERAAESGARGEAIEALESVPADAPAHVQGDAIDALGRLGVRISRSTDSMAPVSTAPRRVPVIAGATRTGAPDYRTRAPGEEPPPAIGNCDFTGASGHCANPGRWDRDGLLSCTTHALARDPQPWRP